MKATLHRSLGRVHYHKQHVTLDISQGIVDFYYSLIPKAWYAQRQAHKAHITIMRLGREKQNSKTWKYRDKELIPFFYSSYIHFEHPYFFLYAYSEDIGGIRKVLGLPQFRYPFKAYHITVGNLKS